MDDRLNQYKWCLCLEVCVSCVLMKMRVIELEKQSFDIYNMQKISTANQVKVWFHQEGDKIVGDDSKCIWLFLS